MVIAVKSGRRLALVILLTSIGLSLLPIAVRNSGAAVPSVSTSGCTAGRPPAGFQTDIGHTGSISPAQYSASGDIQASMIYDQYQAGRRTVFTDLTAPVSASTDQVIECVAMRFSSSTGARRFLESFEYLRSNAGSIAQRVALVRRLRGHSVGYRETQQSFTGYHISSTTVIETADQNGRYFYDVSVAGTNPAVSTALTYLDRMVGGG